MDHEIQSKERRGGRDVGCATVSRERRERERCEAEGRRGQDGNVETENRDGGQGGTLTGTHRYKDRNANTYSVYLGSCSEPVSLMHRDCTLPV